MPLVNEILWSLSQWTATNQKDLEAVISTFMASQGVPHGLAAIVAAEGATLTQGALEKAVTLHVDAGTVTIKDNR